MANTHTTAGIKASRDEQAAGEEPRINPRITLCDVNLACARSFVQTSRTLIEIFARCEEGLFKGRGRGGRKEKKGQSKHRDVRGTNRTMHTSIY